MSHSEDASVFRRDTACVRIGVWRRFLLFVSFLDAGNQPGQERLERWVDWRAGGFGWVYVATGSKRKAILHIVLLCAAMASRSSVLRA